MYFRTCGQQLIGQSLATVGDIRVCSANIGRKRTIPGLEKSGNLKKGEINQGKIREFYFGTPWYFL